MSKKIKRKNITWKEAREIKVGDFLYELLIDQIMIDGKNGELKKPSNYVRKIGIVIAIRKIKIDDEDGVAINFAYDNRMVKDVKNTGFKWNMTNGKIEIKKNFYATLNTLYEPGMDFEKVDGHPLKELRPINVGWRCAFDAAKINVNWNTRKYS
jgi:hypothetical protein